ncbi:MAG: ferrous iron transport protein B [Anaerolineales bacterium]|nr:ferrous iron transport protein B [Anaerolineales bacterium]
MTDISIALAGNPNAGKSTIFNYLTGSRQHVGNWPGKTVDKKEGKVRVGDHNIHLIDLPGTYSLSAFSQEEIVTRDYLIEEVPDVTIIVLDATNLERNLYLAVQVLELGQPAVIALNMADVAETIGIQTEIAKLETYLGVPIVSTIGRKGIGVEELIQAAVSVSYQENSNRRLIQFNSAIEKEINEIEAAIATEPQLFQKYPSRWLAIKLLEQDEHILCQLSTEENAQKILGTMESSLGRLEKELGDDDIETWIVGERYEWINQVVHDVSKSSQDEIETVSDKVDKVLTHPWMGIPVFFVVMWAIFKLTTDVAAPLITLMEKFFSGPVPHFASILISWLGLTGTWAESLILDGLISGVGGVMIFLPVLVLLFLALALLEDSGYMARAALIMDRLMRPLGLHGKSFLPMLIGFGCNVPAIYATKTLENQKDRILTSLMIPFMSCGARLSVYVFFATIFFPKNSGTIIFILYILGIVLALLAGLVLRKTIFKHKENVAFMMELPSYRLPTVKGVWFYVWERSKAFLKNVTTVILVASVILWFLLAIPVNGGKFSQIQPADSAYAAVSNFISPVFKPLGFGSWEYSGALISGFVAKEVVVSTLSQINGDVVGIGNIPQHIIDDFSRISGGHAQLAAMAFLVFVLLYVPCIATLSVEKQEIGLKWALVTLVMQMGVAWVMAWIVFQGGLLLGLG